MARPREAARPSSLVPGTARPRAWLGNGGSLIGDRAPVAGGAMPITVTPRLVPGRKPGTPTPAVGAAGVAVRTGLFDCVGETGPAGVGTRRAPLGGPGAMGPACVGTR